MRSSWRDLFPPLFALLLAASLAAGGTALTENAAARWLVFVVAVFAGSLIIVLWSARRASRLARINIEARRMLSPEHASPRDAGFKLASPELDEPDDDVQRLRETLGQLGARMAAQIKTAAKKSRNLETLVDAIADPLLATDANDEVLLCNAAMERFASAPRGTLLSRPIRGLFTRGEVLDLHARAKAGSTATGRAQLTTELGPRTYEITATPLPAAWGEGVFGTLLLLRDITDLALAVRMQKDFVASASHELRTPIAAVRMATETLRDGAADEPAMRDKLLGTIDNHSQRLEELVRDLMDLSRLETADTPVNLEPVSLDSLAQNLRQYFEPLCTPRRNTLRFTIDPARATLRTDPRLLNLILRNLIDNAVKFAHDNTIINITISSTPIGTRIEVIDQGVGIPLAHQDRVWERFYQVDPARTGTANTRRGTGLGLALVKHAAESLQGRAGLESVWGQGTTVWVELPSF